MGYHFMIDYFKFPDTVCGGDAAEFEIGIYNELVPLIYFCTDAPRNGSFYKVGRIEVIQ